MKLLNLTRQTLISLQITDKIYKLQGEINELQQKQSTIEFESQINQQYGDIIQKQKQLEKQLQESQKQKELEIDDLDIIGQSTRHGRSNEEEWEDELSNNENDYNVVEPEEIKNEFNMPTTSYDYDYALKLSKKYPTFMKMEEMIEIQDAYHETGKQKAELIQTIRRDEKNLTKTQRSIFNETQKVYDSLTNMERDNNFAYKPKTYRDIMHSTKKLYE